MIALTIPSHASISPRWMVHTLDWGVLSTISSRIVQSVDSQRISPAVVTAVADESVMPVPFGNIYSFVDGTCDNSTGIPYIYGTYLDQTFVDSQYNKAVSLSLSEASLPSVCGGKSLPSCTISRSSHGDPENPICARLVLSGFIVVLSKEDEEYDFAKQAIFHRHSSMEEWPEDHNWVVAKIDVQDIWLIDFFGGAAVLNIDAYKAVNLMSMEDEDK